MHRRGFSLIEMLIALAISAMVLAASLAALDALFKSYQATSEQASTHIVARMVMHRVMTMIRTGEQFAPYPVDVLDNTQNPLVDQSAVEFVSWSDPNSDDYNITRLERRPAAPYTVGPTTYELRGPFVLWVMTYKYDIDGMTMEEQPLLDGVDDVTFTLEYAVGPRLRRATMDLSVRTNSDVTYDVGGNEGKVKHTIGMIEEAPPVRLVASVTPRRLD
jgi:prepilin-type N-terminal cleavage/methylation domain-containing protein